MHSRLVAMFNRLASLLKHSRGPTSSGVIEAAPLDPLERLQRSGSTFPVVMEFTRLGW